jgi:hypothetical protein
MLLFLLFFLFPYFSRSMFLTSFIKKNLASPCLAGPCLALPDQASPGLEYDCELMRLTSPLQK